MSVTCYLKIKACTRECFKLPEPVCGYPGGRTRKKIIKKGPWKLKKRIDVAQLDVFLHARLKTMSYIMRSGGWYETKRMSKSF